MESNRKPCMLLLDSLQSAISHTLKAELQTYVPFFFVFEFNLCKIISTGTNCSVLIQKNLMYRFVKNIFKQEDKEEADVVLEYPFEIPKVPQQKDSSKCGQYVLYYIYKFLMMCPEYYNYQEDYPGFVSTKKQHISLFVLFLYYFEM